MGRVKQHDDGMLTVGMETRAYLSRIEDDLDPTKVKLYLSEYYLLTHAFK